MNIQRNQWYLWETRIKDPLIAGIKYENSNTCIIIMKYKCANSLVVLAYCLYFYKNEPASKSELYVFHTLYQ
jgi:hypothetical protein